MVELVYFIIILGIILLVMYENMMVIKYIFLVIFFISVVYVCCDELRFLVVGDWGGMFWFLYIIFYEIVVSIVMGKVV